MSEPIKDLGQLIDELIAVRVKQSLASLLLLMSTREKRLREALEHSADQLHDLLEHTPSNGWKNCNAPTCQKNKAALAARAPDVLEEIRGKN